MFMAFPATLLLPTSDRFDMFDVITAFAISFASASRALQAQSVKCCVQVEGMQLVIDDLVGSTGLELKVDPGVPYVYAGFAGIL